VGLALLLVVASVLLGARAFVLVPDDEKKFAALAIADAWRLYVLWWWLLALPAVAGLLIRRRWPLAAFLLAAASAAAHQLQPVLRMLPMDLAVVITLYTFASLTRSRRASVATLAGALVAVCAVSFAGLFEVARIGPQLVQRPQPVGGIQWEPNLLLDVFSVAAVPALLLGIAWAVGDNTRTRRLYQIALEQRAADLQRERDQRAALAVAAERARITRELHDVVAHGVSVMVVQAQAAAAAQQRHPEVTAEALVHVIDTGRGSLAEMRRVLGLRRDAPLLEPQPGIGALPALIDEVRGAGTPVALQVDGDPVPLPAGVDLSAYRIVQEALTNTRKHAGAGARATVRLAFEPDRLEIEVADDGRVGPGPSTSDGSGLRGIEERVGALGGSVSTGPRPNGGFGIHAFLPIPVAS